MKIIRGKRRRRSSRKVPVQGDLKISMNIETALIKKIGPAGNSYAGPGMTRSPLTSGFTCDETGRITI
jgi:hypothetical protein